MQLAILLCVASIAFSAPSLDLLRSRFEAQMANIVALEARITPVLESRGADFPLELLASDRYDADRMVRRLNGRLTSQQIRTEFRSTRDLIGGKYMNVLQDLLLATQDDLLALYEERDTPGISFDYATSVGRLMGLVNQHDPHNKGIVKSTRRVEEIYSLIKTEKNAEKLESDITALFREVASKRGKSFLAATVRAACTKVQMTTNDSDLVNQKIAQLQELMTGINREKVRAIEQHRLGY
jgi:hypothetical protein